MVNFQTLSLPVSHEDGLHQPPQHRSYLGLVTHKPWRRRNPNNRTTYLNTSYVACARISGFKPKSWVLLAQAALKPGPGM